jgi:uncharacterized membrane protein YtjA (UPF0391 family)
VRIRENAGGLGTAIAQVCDGGVPLLRRPLPNSVKPLATHRWEDPMLRYAAIFFVIAIIAAVFGFGGIAAGAAEIAKILFFIFIVIFLITLLMGVVRR